MLLPSEPPGISQEGNVQRWEQAGLDNYLIQGPALDVNHQQSKYPHLYLTAKQSKMVVDSGCGTLRVEMSLLVGQLVAPWF